MIFIVLQVVAVIVGAFAWWVLFGLNCYFNGLSLSAPGPSWALPFYGLAQDARWFFMPWTKTQHIRNLCDNCGDSGIIGDYTVQEIRAKNLYAWVAWKELPGPFDFIFNHVVVPLAPFGFVKLLQRAIEGG